MPEPQAYLNGQFVPASQAMLPVSDSGLVLGASVAEQLRTFGGRLFKLPEHLERLRHSLEIIGVVPPIPIDEMARVADELATANHRLLDPADDLGMAMFVTPGPFPTMVPRHSTAGPTICMHTFPLPFYRWAGLYQTGESLVTTDVEQTSPRSLPRELKCRSRMHYYLAETRARKIDPTARALMLDQEGFVTETTTANIVGYFPGEGLVGPPRSKVLPGISLAVLLELAEHVGIAYRERDLLPDDLAGAQEVLIASTSPCIVPAVRLNGRPIGQGKPGPIHEALLAAWSRLVGLDIAAQAARFAGR